MTPGWSRALQTRVDSREAPSSLDTGGVEGTPRYARRNEIAKTRRDLG